MRFWFQNLKKEDREKRLFHFRGSISADKKKWLGYSFASGPALKLKYQHGEAGDSDTSSMLILGFIFFTVYLTFALPDRLYFKRKCVAAWDNNREFYLVDGREYGFYVYDWAFVWHWHKKMNESSSRDPWWMDTHFRIDDFFLGRRERLEDKLASAENIHFKLGGHDFVMDSIKWERNRSFRRHIPYSLFHRTWYSVQMDIKKPPQFSGKGENSWDCGDDAIYGSSGPWKHAVPTWLNYREAAEMAVRDYAKSVLKNARRYGGSSSELGINKDSEFEYVGIVS